VFAGTAPYQDIFDPNARAMIDCQQAGAVFQGIAEVKGLT
jgi:hypothetical protein